MRFVLCQLRAQLRELLAQLVGFGGTVQRQLRQLRLQGATLLFGIQPLALQCLDFGLVIQRGCLVRVELGQRDNAFLEDGSDLFDEVVGGDGLFALQRKLAVDLANLCGQHADTRLQVVGPGRCLWLQVGQRGANLRFLRAQLRADHGMGIAHAGADEIGGNFEQRLARVDLPAFMHKDVGDGASDLRS